MEKEHIMPENEEIRFQSQYTSDWDARREIQAGAHSALSSHIALQIYLIVLAPLMVWMCWADPNSQVNLGFLFLGILMVILEVKNFLGKRQKSIQYKRLLLQNGGILPTVLTSFSDRGFSTQHLESGNPSPLQAYTLVERILETQNFFLLQVPYRLCVPIRKDTLSGGSQEDFVDYLRQHCPNLKSQQVHTPTLGRVLHAIALTLVLLGVVILQFRKIGVL